MRTTTENITDFITSEKEQLENYTRGRIDERFFGLSAADIVSEVALNLFTKLDPDRPIENIAAFFYRSLRNKISDLRRQKQRFNSIETLLANHYDLADESDDDARIVRIYEAIDKIHGIEKAIIIENLIEGKTLRELSDAWNLPYGTLTAKKHRALAKLKIEILKGDTNE
jgi:RNA polymerase sigma factor (sigma-70 family)